MNAAQAAVLRRRIAERWPEALDLDVVPEPNGAKVSMTLEGRIQFMDVAEDGLLLEFLLSRPAPGE